MLYAACARAALAQGFDEVQTFILKSESGVSLTAAGWIEDQDYERKGESDWDCDARPRRPADERNAGPKRRFFKPLSPAARAHSQQMVARWKAQGSLEFSEVRA
jgi:hypothetical protein